MSSMSGGGASAPVRTAVIGVGHLGRHHARLLSSMPGTSFVAAVDLIHQRAVDAAAASGAVALTDYRDLWGRVDAATADVLEQEPHLALAVAVEVADGCQRVGVADLAGALAAVPQQRAPAPASRAA